MAINHRNFAQTTLGAAITDTSGTSITVTSETSFPSAPFIISIDTECLLVSVVSGTTWTVTRGYEGSTAATHLNGASVFHDISAAEADAIAGKKTDSVSATDKVLGRSSAGSGAIEEIACTAAGRALLDDANAAAQRATLEVPRIPIFSRMREFESECLSYSGLTELGYEELGGGWPSQVNEGDKNHPGVIGFKSSTTANSGLSVGHGANCYFVDGGEMFEFIFAIDNTSGTIVYAGIHNSITYAAPTRGIFFKIDGTTLSAVSVNSDGTTNSGTTYAITQAVWYRAKLTVNSDVTSVVFELYTCIDGALVWTQTITGNMVADTSALDVRMTATNAGTTSLLLFALDWYHFKCDRVLVR